MVSTDFFATVEFFSGFSPVALQTFADVAQTRTYHRGDSVFALDEPATELHIVRTGRIAIANRNAEGRESLLALMGPGDLFGEMAVFDEDGRRSAGARALEPSEVVALPFGPIKDHFTTDNNALWAVVALLVRRLRAADEALADSVFLDVTGRTAKRLLEVAGENDEFQLPITQEELAGMIGASRERVNKAIAQFVRLGWLSQNERTYRIVDRRKLTQRAS